MKIALAMIMCTALYQECLPPHTIPETYRTHYDCLEAGYKESIRKLEGIGREEINKYSMDIRFRCTGVKPKEEDT